MQTPGGPMHIATKSAGAVHSGKGRQWRSPAEVEAKKIHETAFGRRKDGFSFLGPDKGPMFMLGMLAATGRNSMRRPSAKRGVQARGPTGYQARGDRAT